jgi:hypothetical protein
MDNEIFGLPVEYKSWDRKGLLPLNIGSAYRFKMAVIGDVRCIVLDPINDIPTLPALKKQLEKIRIIDNAPIIIKLNHLSPHRKKNLIKNNIAFVTNKQAYLPFIGAILSNENEKCEKCEKLCPSAQELFLLYLYNNKKKFYVKDALNILPFTAMTLSRAVKQLEVTGLFKVTKDGVSNIIESKYDRIELFNKARDFLSSPVRRSGYIDKVEVTANMMLAGESALANESMLNVGKVVTLAVFEKSYDKQRLFDELIDPEHQVKLELWKYEPSQFSQGDCADLLSVALSFENTIDERIEQAVEEVIVRELSS